MKARNIFVALFIATIVFGIAAYGVTWRTDRATTTQTVTTEESNKVGFAYYAPYTENALTVEYDGVETHAFLTITKEETITAEAPDTVTADANFTEINIAPLTATTLCGIVDTIEGYTGYTASLPVGADCFQIADDLVTAADKSIDTSTTFLFTAADSLGISKVIPAPGVGKQIYINRIVALATGSGAEKVAVYDGYSTVLWEEVLTNSTEKVIDFGTFGLVCSANTKCIVRVYAGTTLTAGYIRVMGYVR